MDIIIDGTHGKKERGIRILQWKRSENLPRTRHCNWNVAAQVTGPTAGKTQQKKIQKPGNFGIRKKVQLRGKS